MTGNVVTAAVDIMNTAKTAVRQSLSNIMHRNRGSGVGPSRRANVRSDAPIIANKATNRDEN